MADEPTDVYRLIYRSRDLIPPEQRKKELGTLFLAARSNNKQSQISGALLLSDTHFVQTLEGAETAVRDLFTHIERDHRHDEVTVIEAGTVDDRVFARWAMARVAPVDGEPDTYLIAHQDGISAAASRGTTPQQEAVLAVMRKAME